MASRSTKPLLLRRPTKNRTTQSNNNPRLSKNSKDSKNSTNSTNKSTTRNGTRSDKNKQGRGIGKHGGHSKGKHSNGKASADAKKKKLARTRSKNRSHDKSSNDKSSKQSKHRRHQKHVKGKRIGDILGKQADDQVDVERVRMFYDWSPLRLLCYDISESNWFSVSILTIILMNTILIALQTVNDLAIDLGKDRRMTRQDRGVNKHDCCGALFSRERGYRCL